MKTMCYPSLDSHRWSFMWKYQSRFSSEQLERCARCGELLGVFGCYRKPPQNTPLVTFSRFTFAKSDLAIRQGSTSPVVYRSQGQIFLHFLLTLVLSQVWNSVSRSTLMWCEFGCMCSLLIYEINAFITKRQFILQIWRLNCISRLFFVRQDTVHLTVT